MGLVTLEAVGCIRKTIAVSYLQKAGIVVTFAGRLALEKAVKVIDCNLSSEFHNCHNR